MGCPKRSLFIANPAVVVSRSINPCAIGARLATLEYGSAKKIAAKVAICPFNEPPPPDDPAVQSRSPGRFI